MVLVPNARIQVSVIRDQKRMRSGRMTRGEGRGYATAKDILDPAGLRCRSTGIRSWQHLATGVMPHAAGPGRTLHCSFPMMRCLR